LATFLSNIFLNDLKLFPFQINQLNLLIFLFQGRKILLLALKTGQYQNTKAIQGDKLCLPMNSR
jgi:hypothetical protein